MSHFWSTALLSTALMAPIAMAPTALRAEGQKAARSYHDKQHNDDHAWNGQEDKAYRIYAKPNHRKYSDFSNSKKRINRVTGTGAMSIQTPCSRSRYISFDHIHNAFRAFRGPAGAVWRTGISAARRWAPSLF